MYSVNSAKTNSMEGVHCKVQKDSDIRRFLLKVPEMGHLKNHLRSLFNISPQQDFVVKYKDEENDMITVASNDDLVLALTISKGNLLRLVVTLVGDKAEMEVVKCEDGNLVKKENEEFLCGKGRKFAKKEQKAKWKKFAEEGKCFNENNNGPQMNPQCESFVPQQNDNTAPSPFPFEMKAKLFAQKEKVLKLKMKMRELKSLSPAPEEEIKATKEQLTNEKIELFALRRQFHELKMSRRNIRCAERMRWKAERMEKRAQSCHGRPMRYQNRSYDEC